MTPIFCFMYLWYSLVTKLQGWILTGTFITMITVKMMIMITTLAIVVTISVIMITVKIMTVIHLRCRHVCLREHICEKFLQDRRCENGKRQNNNFPVLSASAQILQIRMLCNLYWTPIGYLIFITNASYDDLVPGWQKLHGSTGATRRKVWTQTKILSPNIRYFVAILRFVAIYHFIKLLLSIMQDSLLLSRFRQKSPELNK